jgi:hypothetical protein
MPGVQWEDLWEAFARARAAGGVSVLDDADPEEQPCVECGSMIGSRGRWYSDGTGALEPYCAGCAERKPGKSG